MLSKSIVPLHLQGHQKADAKTPGATRPTIFPENVQARELTSESINKAVPEKPKIE